MRRHSEQQVALPAMDLAYDEEPERGLSGIAGGLGLVLARTPKVLDPKPKYPQTDHRDTAFRIFDLLL